MAKVKKHKIIWFLSFLYWLFFTRKQFCEKCVKQPKICHITEFVFEPHLKTCCPLFTILFHFANQLLSRTAQFNALFDPRYSKIGKKNATLFYMQPEKNTKLIIKILLYYSPLWAEKFKHFQMIGNKWIVNQFWVWSVNIS